MHYPKMILLIREGIEGGNFNDLQFHEVLLYSKDALIFKNQLLENNKKFYFSLKMYIGTISSER